MDLVPCFKIDFSNQVNTKIVVEQTSTESENIEIQEDNVGRDRIKIYDYILKMNNSPNFGKK